MAEKPDWNQIIPLEVKVAKRYDAPVADYSSLSDIIAVMLREKLDKTDPIIPKFDEALKSYLIG